MKPTDTNHVCLVCGRVLSLIAGDPNSFHPTIGCIEGNVLVVEGGYGSEVFDPISSGYYLAGAICNSCLREKMGNLFLMSKNYEPDIVVENIYEEENNQ